jgi:hypothetical protein
MLATPNNYINSVIKNAGGERCITSVTNHFINKNEKNLHFIIDEDEIDISSILIEQCKKLKTKENNEFKIGQKLISKQTDCNEILEIICLSPKIKLKGNNPQNHTVITINNLDEYIPISNCPIKQIGSIKNIINEYKKCFNAESQDDFFNSEKLLVIGNKNLYEEISQNYPSCYVSQNLAGNIEIIYNSPVLPKITFLRSINLLDKYKQKELNGNNITFSTCIFVGSSKFENSVNTIRNYYNKKYFSRVIFIGDKDINIDLGNNQSLLRWKWTIPEISFFKNEEIIQHDSIIIENQDLKKSIEEFYNYIRKIEEEFTVKLASIYKFIRYLYCDWRLTKKNNLIRLNEIQKNFNSEIDQLLNETLGNLEQDIDYDEYKKQIIFLYQNIINAIKTNNKTQEIEKYTQKINQFILPTFLCEPFNDEFKKISEQPLFRHIIKSLQDLSQIKKETSESKRSPDCPYYSLWSNVHKCEFVLLSKSDDTNTKYNKVISSIYGFGKINKLIEKLSRARTKYTFILYSVENDEFQFYKNKYKDALNKEYTSSDRFEICGVKFNDNYYEYTSYDEWLDDYMKSQVDSKEKEYYQITFIDNCNIRLQTSKKVLKIFNGTKQNVSVQDLNVGDNILIYVNPEKEILKDIIEIENPEIKKQAEEYSNLWKICLRDAYKNIFMDEPLFSQLRRNHFSVSKKTLKRYLEGDVMFPRSFSNLIVIAKTINDTRLSLNFLKNTMKPIIDEYRGLEIEYGFKFSNSINNFILTKETNEFISKWFSVDKIEEIVSKMKIKKIKKIEQNLNINDD